MKLTGVFLPIITPFQNGEIDMPSYRKLVRYYCMQGISGLIPLGTTGEGSTVNSCEFKMVVEATLGEVDGALPIYVGLGGNDTHQVIRKLKEIEEYEIDGILSVCPYYSRPSQKGLYQHFLSISESTPLDIIIYNIPYRTGINLENDMLLRLAECKNIVGVKDSCGDIKQSLHLLRNKPEDFSVLTGEDHLFFTTVANGGDGGILAASHFNTEIFLNIWQDMTKNDVQSALAKWRAIEDIIPLLFEEPNPGPIKYCLYRQGLITTPDVRLPLSSISEDLRERLEKNAIIPRRH